ncbi:uncharacterized protein F4807DRAFT_29131 [Annulohypoxylon truncatum]|uniref:uncharacterized protein n=1 Tax=Annulohypoxylon truncatum TaxID=327061 RepID=UPI0020089D64|nr:uncharacterized protein F4807DRAFT_29131 [Annulohypoxylon truncatum]KAI1211225.1 hypothetical protein F4807DRAFT_29131 [Annulohypoxylon truncatum]
MPDLSSLSPAELQQFLDGPALTPPDGVIPNFDNRDNKDYISQAVLPLCLVLTTIAVFLRVWARIFCIKKIELPDVLMTIAYGCYITNIVFGYRLTENPGVFVHTWDIRVKDMSSVLYPLFLSASFYIGVVLTIKAAILLEWARIFIPYGVRNRFFWCVYAVLGANTIFYIIVLFLMNFACTPVQKNWDPLFVGGSCPINTQAVNIASAVLNLCSDIFILLLPQRIIWGLKMSTKTKTGVSIIFAFGIICIIAAGFRLGAEIDYTKSEDVIYNISPVLLWALAEMTCMFLVFGVPSGSKIMSDLRIPSKLASSLRSLGGRFQRNSSSRGSGSGAASWPRSSMIMNNSHADSSRTYYRKLENGHGGMQLTTIDSTQGQPPSESTEYLKDQTNMLPAEPEAGMIIRTTHFVTREDYGGYEHNLAVGDGYDRQHPWAKERV